MFILESENLCSFRNILASRVCTIDGIDELLSVAWRSRKILSNIINSADSHTFLCRLRSSTETHQRIAEQLESLEGGLGHNEIELISGKIDYIEYCIKRRFWELFSQEFPGREIANTDEAVKTLFCFPLLECYRTWGQLSVGILAGHVSFRQAQAIYYLAGKRFLGGEELGKNECILAWKSSLTEQTTMEYCLGIVLPTINLLDFPLLRFSLTVDFLFFPYIIMQDGVEIGRIRSGLKEEYELILYEFYHTTRDPRYEEPTWLQNQVTMGNMSRFKASVIQS